MGRHRVTDPNTPLGVPPAITSSVPITGRAARYPGNGDSPSSANDAPTMMSMPAIAGIAHRATGADPRILSTASGHRTIAAASTPPAANSHARVVVAKYANAGSKA